MSLALLSIPTLALALLLVGVPVVLAVAGLLLVRSCAPPDKLKPYHDVAGVIYSGLATLYAVILAFVVIEVWQQFDSAHSHVDKEASALGNLFRDAQAFPDPLRREILEAVRTYTQAVIKDEWNTMARGKESSQARKAYVDLWQAIRKVEPHSPYEVNWHAELIRTLNTASELRRSRISDSMAATSGVLWAVLIAGAIISVGYSYLFGVESIRVHILITAALTAMTAFAFFLLVVTDHPFAGDLRVDSEPFERQLKSFEHLLQQETTDK